MNSDRRSTEDNS